jgi:type III secretory pathway lipoprotein EscJ
MEPLLVTHNAGGEVEGIKYDRLSVVLINAVQQQQSQLQQQQQQKALLRQQIEQQRTEFEELKGLVCRSRPRAAACRVARQSARLKPPPSG